MRGKKIAALLLAIGMMLSMAACGTAATSQQSSESQPAPAVTPEAAAPAASAEEEAAQPEEEAPAEAEMSDVDKQLVLLHSQIANLEQPVGELPWYYTVVDLDHDGNLEFFAASQHPEDRSTNLKAWEFSEDRTKLIECRVNKDPEESFPDIMTDSMDTYHDVGTDTWYYLFYDNVVLSDTEIYTSKSAFNLKDGEISYEAFAVEHAVVDYGVRYVSHTDATGLEISAEQYNASGANAFLTAERSSTSFEWLTAEEANDLTRLVDSYAVFTGVKEPTEVFPVPKPSAMNYPEAEATPAPTPEPVPVPTPVPAPTPAPAPAPVFLTITKNPTNENRKIGGTATFVACANTFESLTWTLVAPDGGQYSTQQFSMLYPNSPVSGIYSTTLTIGNVASGMNGWGAFCTFYYKGQTARTTTAYILIKDAAPQPDPVDQHGSFDGNVTDYGYDYVQVEVKGVDYFTVQRSICTIYGELYVGAPATVYYDAKYARGVHVSSCVVTGREPSPQPVYGSMSGTAYHDTAFTVYVVLQNGNGYHLRGELVSIIGGNDIEGAPCVVYYTDYPSESTVYRIEIFGRDVEIVDEPEIPEGGGWAGSQYYANQFATHEGQNGDGSTYEAFWCPDCGAEVPVGRDSCDNCGAGFN